MVVARLAGAVVGIVVVPAAGGCKAMRVADMDSTMIVGETPAAG